MPLLRLPAPLWRHWCAAISLVMCAAQPMAVQAARPMNTDDANVVDPKGCQLETWV